MRYTQRAWVPIERTRQALGKTTVTTIPFACLIGRAAVSNWIATLSSRCCIIQRATKLEKPINSTLSESKGPR